MSIMVSHQISNNGICNTCEAAASDNQMLECSECDMKYHADCNNTTPFCTKTFLKSFKIKSLRGNNEASTVKDQLAAVVSSLAVLTKEVAALKSGNNEMTVKF